MTGKQIIELSKRVLFEGLIRPLLKVKFGFLRFEHENRYDKDMLKLDIVKMCKFFRESEKFENC